MTDTDLDALISRLNKPSGTAFYDAERTKAAAALVQLRDSEALARGKIAEQMIEIARLQDDTAEIDRLRGENARIKDSPSSLALSNALEDLRLALKRIAALEAERDTYHQLANRNARLMGETLTERVEQANRIEDLEAECDQMRAVIEAAKAMRENMTPETVNAFDAAIDAAREKP